MSANLHPLRAYRDTATRTASRGQLTLMLFDGALRFLELAGNGFAETNFITRNQQINNNLVKTFNILVELQVTLNMEVGGEFAQRMYALYGFMQDQVMEANMQKTMKPIEVVKRLLGEIRDAWAEMLAGTGASTNAATTNFAGSSRLAA